jgi:hypothetical protein
MRSALSVAAALLFTSLTASAQSIAVMPCGTLVAHDRAIELIGCPTAKWKSEGVSHDGPIFNDEQHAVVLDSIASVARVVDLATGRARTVATGETPTGGALLGGQLFVLARDAKTLERIAADGTRTSIATGNDPQFRVNNGRLYVYSRIEGKLQEISPEPFAVIRSVDIPPRAVDYIVDTAFMYFIYPRESMLRTYSTETFEKTGEGTIGELPMDIELAAKPDLLTARVVALADPSARRVWLVEGAQSTTKAVLRGFVRGLIGAGVFAGGSRDFPVGVDRLLASDEAAVAYDSSSGTLYQIISKKKSRRIATGIAPRAFAVTDEAAIWWDGKQLQQSPF